MNMEKVGVVGLGYVGLPLAAAFSRAYDVVGFDVNETRIADLKKAEDETNEVTPEELRNPRLTFTTNASDLSESTVLVVAVPTPITRDYTPDLSYLESASAVVGGVLKPGMLVVFESTVYPGVTEEVCLPVLEKVSGLKLGEFQLGYSPERVNPGDKEHTIDRVVKVVSGHDDEALARTAALYQAIVHAGVHQAATIKVAEAAKVVENVQLDLNISLMNELSKIFALLEVDTHAVIDAASTKWNFHRYTPGLVGGHCIGVDPYYLTKRAQDMRYNPEVILSGRRINDGMGTYVAEMVVRDLIQARCFPQDAHVLIMGLTFKENVPDLRNTRATDVVDELLTQGVKVSVCEPLFDDATIRETFGYEPLALADAADLDAVVVINGHDAFMDYSLADLRSKMRTPVMWDIKQVFSRSEAESLGFHYSSL